MYEAGDPKGPMGPEDVALRSELATLLEPSMFPLDAGEVRAAVSADVASTDLVTAVRSLADDAGPFTTVGELWRALGRPVEERDDGTGDPYAAHHAGAPDGRLRAVDTGPRPDVRAGLRVVAPPAFARERYAFRFDPLLVPLAALFGVTPFTASVMLDDDALTVRFGPWSLSTTFDNVAGVSITGPYRLVKVAGPPHVSIADLGITFATSRRRGVCITFHRGVPAALPTGLLRHRGCTVTVAEPHQFAADLRARAGLDEA